MSCIHCQGTGTVSRAVRDVVCERQRQVEAEGWTLEQDDFYTEKELSHAAAKYALHGSSRVPLSVVPWPWRLNTWKPTTYRRNLVKAAALLIAEIERLDRKEGKG